MFRDVMTWVGVGLAVGLGAPAPAQEKPAAPALAARVKELFRDRCGDCHGPETQDAGLDLLKPGAAREAKVVEPGKPDESKLFLMVTGKKKPAMPKGRLALSPDQVELIRAWIAAGAPDVPSEAERPKEPDKEAAFQNVVGVDYVLKQILDDVRKLKPGDVKFVRYLSINHVLTAGATPAVLDELRAALAIAVNHLTWEPALVIPRAVDPAKTIYAVDLRDLGWHLKPFEVVRGRERLGQAERGAGRAKGEAPFELFDLALLEYPYAIAYPDSDTYAALAREYLQPSGMARPVPYVRADWFVSTATLPPLYEDFIRLPYTVADLEARLGVPARANVDADRARRAGLSVSGVSRNNRMLERHPAAGYYWKSTDFKSSKGAENLFKDPLTPKAAGGEFIFQLPNRLQGYFIVNGNGVRLEAAITEIVTDANAADATVRNGLSCIRCHDQGMKPFADVVRPAVQALPGSPGFDKAKVLSLYADRKEMDALTAKDGQTFQAALTQLLGKVPDQEPLIPVTQRFLDRPLHLAAAAGELGLTDLASFKAQLKLPAFTTLGLAPLATEGVVRRDAWEDYFDPVVRALGLGQPLPPVDGLTRKDFPAGPAPLPVEFKTNKAVFQPGDKLVLTVRNPGPQPVCVEVVGTSARGDKVILTEQPLWLKPGQELRYPPTGGFEIQGWAGKEQFTLYASDKEFAPAVLLRTPTAAEARKEAVADRVVHPFFGLTDANGRLRPAELPGKLMKATIEVETK